MSECQWLDGSRCKLAGLLAGVEVMCSAGACVVCKDRHKSPTIESPGTVVASLVIKADVSQLEAMRPHLLQGTPGQRPGTPKREPRTTAMLPCTHRGEVVRQDTSNLCGTRGDSVNVYECDLHGECALGRYCRHQTVRSCATCGDRSEYPPGN